MYLFSDVELEIFLIITAGAAVDQYIQLCEILVNSGFWRLILHVTCYSTNYWSCTVDRRWAIASRRINRKGYKLQWTQLIEQPGNNSIGRYWSIDGGRRRRSDHIQLRTSLEALISPKPENLAA
jgi:hypothetical protein